jgi:hypothetical protein
VSARICNIVNSYANLLMQLAFDIDDIPLVLEAAGAAGRVVDDPIDLYPTWQVQKQIADAPGDPDLAAAVLEARRRMLAHVEEHDPLAGD